MRRLIVLYFSCISGYMAVGQATVGGVSTKGLDINTSYGGFISEVDYYEKETKGSSYLFKDWVEGELLIKNQLYSNLKLNWDISKDQIEIKVDSKVKIISANNVSQMLTSLGQCYEPSRKFKTTDNIPLNGVFEWVFKADSGYSLLMHYSIIFLKADYIPALATGDKDDKFVLKKQLYFYDGSKVFSVKATKSSVAKDFELKSEKALQILKERKLSVKDQNDLIQFCKEMNK